MSSLPYTATVAANEQNDDLLARPRATAGNRSSFAAGADTTMLAETELFAPQRHRSTGSTLEDSAPRKAASADQATTRPPVPRANPNEYRDFVAEYQALTRKKFEAGLSKSEQNRMALVAWHLDSLESEVDAPAMAALASMAKTHANLAAQVSNVVAEIRRISPSARVSRHGR